MTTPRQDLRTLVAGYYDQALDAGKGRANIADVSTRIREHLVGSELAGDLLDAVVDATIRAEDDRRSAASSAQIDLLAGHESALNEVWKLGAGKRVRIRHATRADLRAHLDLQRQHVDRVTAALRASEVQAAELLPYMGNERVTIATARARWRVAQDARKAA